MRDTSFLLHDQNLTAKPDEDFYDYAIGGWLKKTTIPDDYSRWGSFEILIEETYEKLREILEAPEKIVPQTGSRLAAVTEHADQELAIKIARFYRQGMDEATIEKQGLAPLQPYLQKINAMKSRNDFVAVVAELNKIGVHPLFSFMSTPDARNSKWVIGGLGQDGLGLFEKNYYLAKETEEIRIKYRQHIEKMFKLVGIENAAVEAAVVLKIETELAKASRAKEELRDPVKNYNKMQRRQLIDLAPEFHWQEFFLAVGAENLVDIDVGQPEFFSSVSDLIGSIPLPEWRAYFIWHLIIGTADLLTKNLVDEKFDFYGRVVSGQPKIKDRLKRVIIMMNAYIGEGVGKLFVKKYFPPSAKLRAEKLVKNLIATMGERIENLAWMSDETKKEAQKKLAAIYVKIGYPSKWIDYTTWKTGDSYLETALQARRFEWQREMDKISKPVDREEWLMSPQTVNAYFEPLKNEIVFPAAILQPPFFYDDADDALNYGGIGTVIGHEITHGFDDQGRQYDATGNLRDWWTEEDGQRFKKSAQNFVKQYENVSPLPGLKLNGEFTLGENIADLGGLCVAFAAHKKVADNKVFDGLSPAQRFFISYTQTEKCLIRDERLKMQILTDPHSPSKYRVNVPLSNMREFFDAFGVTDQSKMRRTDPVVIW